MEPFNNLVRVLKTRKRLYEKAIKETKDSEEYLKILFKQMADVSHVYSQELSRYTNSSRLKRIRNKRLNIMSGINLNALLSICKSEEDLAQTAYNKALETGGYLPKFSISYINRRKL